MAAFVVPSSPISSFRMIGAHTDSPNIRLKPRSVFTKEGYVQLGVEVYGGALLSSWLDRDLSLAGRVLLRTKDGIKTRLVHMDHPLLRIPQLAIHLDREVNERGLVLNKQEHMIPILGLGNNKEGNFSIEHWISEQLGVPSASILQQDLMLFDTAAPTRAGHQGEFIFAARLDNLAMCHAGITALIRSRHAIPGGMLPMVVLFDHEEVGSDSVYGAGSNLISNTLERVVSARGGTREDHHRAMAHSLCISADMAHAVHPNYAERHDPRHRPVLNGGPVIKINTQQRYATCTHTAALFTDLCRESNIPFQYYAHRSDLPCGSTIGPITATSLGIRTVDIGSPLLSMHSIREMAGSQDPAYMTQALEVFLKQEKLLEI